MNLDQLLPEYPSIDSPSFYMDIYKKREFYDLRNPDLYFDGFYSHQWMIARFISNWTLYESLIVLHDTGTGKSGVAAATFTGLKKYNPGLQTLYVSNNDTLLNNFKEEIFMLSPLLYDPELKDNSESVDEYTRKRNAILSKAGFTFKTYYKLSQELRKGGDLKNEWNRQFIIMDEIHHLVSHDVEIPPKERKMKKDLIRGEREVSTPYDDILKFIHSLDFKKMLLMTATAMRDSPSEIAPLINLVLRPTQQIPIGKKFINYFFEKLEICSKVHLLGWKDGKEQEFLEKIKGFVSVVKQRVDIPITYVGKIYSPMKYFKLFATVMKNQQMVGYRNAFKLDTSTAVVGKKSSFYSHSQQASLFVFPDGSFGILPKDKNSFMNKKYFNKKFIQATGLVPFDKNISVDKLTPQNIDTLEHNLNIVRLYSSTYYQIIKQIIRNRKKQIYVYCDKINGSGILICIQLLIQFFGYSQFSSPQKFSNMVPNPRVIFLHYTPNQTTKANIPSLIRQFNSPENIEGKYIQVIFGTDMTKEGISLKRIEQIHICSSDWNFGKLWQAKGRGIRLRSHLGMPPDTKVDIFFHCAIPKAMPELPEIQMDIAESQKIEQKQEQQQQLQQQQLQQLQQQGQQQQQTQLKQLQHAQQKQQQQESQGQQQVLAVYYVKKGFQQQQNFAIEQLKQSIDFFRYYLSECKDINISNIEYALLTSSVDCQIQKNQNSRANLVDFSPECNYKPCNYICSGFNSQVVIPDKIDNSTYDLYYVEQFKKETIKFIIDLFQHKTTFVLDEIIRLGMEKKQYTKRQILDAIFTMIDLPIPIPYFDGRELYLNQMNDVLFTSDERMQKDSHDKNQLWAASYSNTPVFDIFSSFDDILSNLKEESIGKTCTRLKTLFVENNPKEAKTLIKLFSESTLLLFIKELISHPNQSQFIKWLIEIVLFPSLYLHSSGKWLYKKSKTDILELEQGQWKKFTGQQQKVVSDAITQDHDDPLFLDKYPNIRGKKAYGFIQGKFKIKDISKEFKDNKEKRTGKVCTYYYLDELYSYVYDIQPTLPSDENLENDAELIAYRDKIQAMSIADINKYIRDGVSVDDFKKNIGKEELSIDDKRFIAFFKDKFNNRPKICNFIQRIFASKGLITKPPIVKNIQKLASKTPGKPGRKPKNLFLSKPKAIQQVKKSAPLQQQQDDLFDDLDLV